MTARWRFLSALANGDLANGDLAKAAAITTIMVVLLLFAADAPAQSDSEAITAAIGNLSAAKFAKRQSAYRFLIRSGTDAIVDLEQAARGEDLDVVERCVKALVEIAKEKESADAALAALDRLAGDQTIQVAALAKSEIRLLKMTDEERAIESLEAAGVRIHRNGQGEPSIVTVARDQDLFWLKFLPTLRSVSLMQTGITDQGLEHLAKCDQIHSLSMFQTAITDVGLGEFGKMSSLTTISISGGSFTAAGIRSLRKVQGLRSLMWHAAINEDQMRAIGDLDQLSTLSLSQITATDGITEVLNEFAHLTRLSLSLRNVTDGQCEQLAKVNVNTSLSIMRADNLTSVGWEHLAKMNLQSLMVYRSPLTDQEMPLIGGMASLTSLSIYGASITDAGLSHLEGLTKLRYLTLRDTEVTETGGEQLKQKLPGLRTVRISSRGAGNARGPIKRAPYNITTYGGRKNVYVHATLDEEALEKLKKEKDINTVYMARGNGNDKQIERIATLSFKELVIDSDEVTDAGLAALKNHRSLHSLTIHSSRLTDHCKSAILAVPSLTKLRIREAGLTDGGTQALLAGLAKKGQLEWLDLSDCPNLSNEALRNIASLESLKQLTFNDNAGTSGAVLHFLDGMSNLTEIRLGGVVIDAADFESLSRLTLQRASFDKAKLRPGAIKALVQSCPKLEQLGLAKSNVGDADMTWIAGLSELEWLALSDTAVSDEGVADLTALKNLTYLAVDASKVSQTAEERFKQSHPDATIRRN